MQRRVREGRLRDAGETNGGWNKDGFTPIFGLEMVAEAGERKEGLAATAADEGPVFVVGFVPDSLRFGLWRDELHFAYQAAAPCLIDAAAEFALHGFQLALPGFTVGRQFEAVADAANGPRVRSQSGSNDTGPRACEPCEGGIGLLEPMHDASEKFSCAFHEVGHSNTTRLWKSARLRRRFGRAKIAKYSSTIPRRCLKASSRGSRCGDIV